MGEVIDRRVLAEVLGLQDEGDSQFVKDLLTAFQESTTEAISGIDAAISNQDPKTVASLAHRLKGSCLSLGAVRMADVCAALETDAQLGSLEGGKERLERIRAEFEQVEQFFRMEFGY